MGEKPTHRTFANGRYSRGQECSRHRHDMAWHGMGVVTDRQSRTSDCPDTYGGTSANIASAPALAIGDTANRQGCRDARLCAPSTKYVSGFCSPQLVVTRNNKRPSVMTRLPVAFLFQIECHGDRLPTDMALDTAPAAETRRKRTRRKHVESSLLQLGVLIPISAASTATPPGRFESPARSSLGSSLAGHHHSCSTRVSVTVTSASLSQGPVLG